MVSERVIGGLIFAVFLIILVVFTAVIWYPPLAAAYSILALKIVDWVLVVGVSAIAIWLGWVMISTKPIVPEDKPEQPPTTRRGRLSHSHMARLGDDKHQTNSPRGQTRAATNNHHKRG